MVACFCLVFICCRFVFFHLVSKKLKKTPTFVSVRAKALSVRAIGGINLNRSNTYQGKMEFLQHCPSHIGHTLK